MIGQENVTIADAVHKELIAFRDAFVTFLVALIAKLIEVGYPPTIETVYMPFLAALLMGIISYAHATGVQLKSNDK